MQLYACRCVRVRVCVWGGGGVNSLYQYVLAVQITAVIEWRLVDPNNVEQVCVRFSVKVVSG